MVFANWGDIKSDGGALPEGTYTVIVQDGKEVTDVEKPYMNVEFGVVSGEYEGRKHWEYLTFHFKMLWRIKKLFQACGVDMDAKGQGEAHVGEIMNKALKISIYHEMYQGKLKSKVREFISLEQAAQEAPPAAAQNESEGTPAAEVQDDNIPF